MFDLLKTDGEAVVLIKPQFELDKSALNKSGIVTDEKLRKKQWKMSPNTPETSVSKY